MSKPPWSSSGEPQPASARADRSGSRQPGPRSDRNGERVQKAAHFSGHIRDTEPLEAVAARRRNRLVCSGFATRPRGFEPLTFGSVDRRSIQLSYGRSEAADESSRWFRARRRRGRDSNPRWRLPPHTRLAGECLQPLGHLSGRGSSVKARRELPKTRYGRPDPRSPPFPRTLAQTSSARYRRRQPRARRARARARAAGGRGGARRGLRGRGPRAAGRPRRGRCSRSRP